MPVFIDNIRVTLAQKDVRPVPTRNKAQYGSVCPLEPIIIVTMKSTSVLAGLAALAAQRVAGHATWQELWVNGVDMISSSV